MSVSELHLDKGDLVVVAVVVKAVSISSCCTAGGFCGCVSAGVFEQFQASVVEC